MKIGIITLPIAENYGGTLQAISLYRLLHNQGHDVVLIYKDFHPNFLKEVIKKLFRKIPFYDFKNIKANYKEENQRQERKKFHRPFIENEIFKISKSLYSKKDLKIFVENENLDAVIVGSDQVWRKQYINDKYYKSYFLDFVNSTKTKKISYAASFGKDHWEGKDDLDDITNCLKDFVGVSTRELSGVNICKNSFNFDDAKHVLDPTLLIGKDFYKNEIISKYDTSRIKKVGILTYVLDEASEKKEIIEYIKNTLNIEKITHLKGFNISKYTYSVPEWLASFANADFIVTDSFHGMAFSIIFEKNFMIIGNKNRGLDRFTSLLTLIGLQDRLIFNLEEIKNKEINSIDYMKVNKILEKNKEISVDFLEKTLHYTTI